MFHRFPQRAQDNVAPWILPRYRPTNGHLHIRRGRVRRAGAAKHYPVRTGGDGLDKNRPSSGAQFGRLAAAPAHLVGEIIHLRIAPNYLVNIPRAGAGLHNQTGVSTAHTSSWATMSDVAPRAVIRATSGPVPSTPSRPSYCTFSRCFPYTYLVSPKLIAVALQN